MNKFRKTIIICADDYGQNVEISQGIINLLARQRLSAVSCITTMPDWPQHARWLQPYADKIDIGLHFNLTTGLSLTQSKKLAPDGHFGALSKLLIATHLRYLNRQEVMAELSQQVDQFVEALGRLPDFIDGHEHVHHLPIISDILIEFCQQQFSATSFYLRSVAEKNACQLLKGPAKFKRAIIYLTGGRRFKQQLLRANIAHNTSFSGIYNFAESTQYEKLFRGFLASIQSGGLIMCHPGLASNDVTDPIYRNRQKEYNYFNSDTFLHDCQTFDVSITSFKHTFSE